MTSALLTIEDSHGTWVVLLRDGEFTYRALGSNTGWHRLRRRVIARHVAEAYAQWSDWRATPATDPLAALALPSRPMRPVPRPVTPDPGERQS